MAHKIDGHIWITNYSGEKPEKRYIEAVRIYNAVFTPTIRLLFHNKAYDVHGRLLKNSKSFHITDNGNSHNLWDILMNIRKPYKNFIKEEEMQI